MSEDPLRALVRLYAPRERRDALTALLGLDDALGNVLRTTREPLVGQMRLAWWREALARLDTLPPPAEPVLTALAKHALPLGLSGRRLAEMVDGWELLLGEPNEVALQHYARLRGDGLFAAAGIVLGSEIAPSVGQGWALADLAGNLGYDALADRARLLARPMLDDAVRRPWPKSARSLGAMVHIARMRLAGPLRPYSVLRLGWHRLTGR